MILVEWMELRRVHAVYFVQHVPILERISRRTGEKHRKRSSKLIILVVKRLLTCQRWLYTLFLAIDANFRLKRRAVSKDTVDPSLSKGWSYFVEELAYKLYLSEHTNTRQEASVHI